MEWIQNGDFQNGKCYKTAKSQNSECYKTAKLQNSECYKTAKSKKRRMLQNGEKNIL